jgi:creatinine amidohydrolase
MAIDQARMRQSRTHFAACVEALPEVAAEALARPIPPPPFDPRRVRRILVTGLGSSEAHARLLVSCLVDELALNAHFVPTGALQEGPPPDASSDALIVFSQGLSPNARFPLAHPERWGAIGLATAVGVDHRDPERREPVTRLRDAGGWLVGFPPPDEFGTLVRITGPLAGCIAAIRMAEQLAIASGVGGEGLRCDPLRVVESVRNAADAVERALVDVDPAALDAPVGYLASDRYAELLHNLRLKWLETLLLPLPPSWELLDFSHGPFQESLTHDVTWLAFTREGALREADLLARLESMLDTTHHHLLRLHATLPGPWALVEHEAQLDHLLLRALEHRAVDLEHWPGQGADGALYDLSPRDGEGAAASTAVTSTRLDTGHWPELEQRLARGHTEVLIPLGATEQHGAHLPLATDTWIADALAERLCARRPGLVRLPALPLGCSEEHAAFSGTLSLRSETLQCILEDLLHSLARHGFTRAFLFSAHGGNCATLEAALPGLRTAAKPMEVNAFTDLSRLARLQHQLAGDEGVSPSAAGHHAGEFETSILLAIAPQHVRREALAAGRLHPDPDAQALFYPDLRANAPSGVIGDPRSADAERAGRYLDAWAELLDDAYRRSVGG